MNKPTIPELLEKVKLINAQMYCANVGTLSHMKDVINHLERWNSAVDRQNKILRQIDVMINKEKAK